MKFQILKVLSNCILIISLWINTNTHCKILVEESLNLHLRVSGYDSIPACLNADFQPVQLEPGTTCDENDEVCRLQFYQELCVHFIERGTSVCPQNYDLFSLQMESPIDCVQLVSSGNLLATDEAKQRAFPELELECETVFTGMEFMLQQLIFYLGSINIDYTSSTDYLFSIYSGDQYHQIALQNIQDCILVTDEFINLDACELIEDGFPTVCESEMIPITVDRGCPNTEISVRYDEFKDYCFTIALTSEIEGLYDLFEPISVTQSQIWSAVVSRHFDNIEIFPEYCLVNVDRLFDEELEIFGGLVTAINPFSDIMIVSDFFFNCVALQRRIDSIQNPTIHMEFDLSVLHRFDMIVFFEENFNREELNDNAFECTSQIFEWEDRPENSLGLGNSFTIEGEGNLRKSIKTYIVHVTFSPYPRYYQCNGVSVLGNALVTTSLQIGYRGHVWLSPIYVVTFKLTRTWLQLPDFPQQVSQITQYIESVWPGLVRFEIYSIKNHLQIPNGMTMDLMMNIEQINNPAIEQTEQNTFELMQTLTNQLTNAAEDIQGFAIKSIMFCFSQFLDSSPNFNWRSVLVGQRASTDDKCLNENILPYTRKCQGDMVIGADWEDFNEADKNCLDQSLINIITLELFEMERLLLSGQADITKVLSRLLAITSNPDSVIAVDLILIARNIELTQTLYNATTRDEGELITDIINNIMDFDNKLISEAAAAELNTTNILLQALDISVHQVAEYNDVGVEIENRTNLIVIRIDPSVSNISGVGLYINSIHKNEFFYLHNFIDYQIRYLYLNQSLYELLEEDELYQSLEELVEDDQPEGGYFLEVATFIPKSLYNWFLKDTPHNPTPFEILITIFHNDKLFQTNQRSFADKVISIKVHGYSTTFPMLLPTVHRRAAAKKSDDFCGFFNFRTNNSQSTLSEWNERGCLIMQQSTDNNLTACGCFHLTHFSFLLFGHQFSWGIDNEALMRVLARHDRILTWITRIFSGLSLLGIFGIFLTSIVIQQWRHEMKNVIILQFAFSIALQIIIIVIADSTVNREKELFECVLLGGSLQYITLVTFSWMFILALRQYQLFVKVFNTHMTSSFYFVAVVIGWIVPLVPTVLTATLLSELYMPLGTEICYPKGSALSLGLILPICLVVGFNLTIYAIVIHSIRMNTVRTKSMQQSYEMAQFRMAIFLFFFLGLTWIFGLISTISNFSLTVKLVFTYMFNLTATLQGFILFLFYIVLNPSTRKLWLKKINETLSSINSEITN